jgi:alpha-ribazole phosphatase
MIVYLVRHTQVNNPANLCYGRSDIGLADSFEREAGEVAAKLPPGSAIDMCISSPSTRCMRLAEYLYGVPVASEPSLMELDFGTWEMQPWDDIDRQAMDRWAEDFVNRPCPGGESFANLSARVSEFWDSLPSRSGSKTVVLVTHGGVIRALLALLHGQGLEKAFGSDVPPGYVTRVEL